MSDKVRMVPLDDIIVGERFRKDYGNMENFVASIKDKGVLQPITLSDSLAGLA